MERGNYNHLIDKILITFSLPNVWKIEIIRFWDRDEITQFLVIDKWIAETFKAEVRRIERTEQVKQIDWIEY